MISITGQMNGNRTLRNAIQYDSIESAGFGNYILHFATKKQAKKALWEAFKYLKTTIDPPYNTIGGLRYSKYGQLSYDASAAKLL